jgi:mevalonate kinase
VAPVDLPEGLGIDAYWSGHSARTSDMRALVEGLKRREKGLFAARMQELSAAAVAAVSAVHRGDAQRFIDAARASGNGLSALGCDAAAPIVPPHTRGLVLIAEEEQSAFLPSGAGGGDVFVRIGLEPPSPRFDEEARALGFEKLGLSVDIRGVHVRGKVGRAMGAIRHSLTKVD